MSPESHCHPTASQEAAGHKCPEHPACVEAGWWHSRARGPTAETSEVVLLVKGTMLRSFLWNRRHQGLSCGKRHGEVLRVAGEAFRSFWWGTRHWGAAGGTWAGGELTRGCLPPALGLMLTVFWGLHPCSCLRQPPEAAKKPQLAATNSSPQTETKGRLLTLVR